MKGLSALHERVLRKAKDRQQGLRGGQPANPEEEAAAFELQRDGRVLLVRHDICRCGCGRTAAFIEVTERGHEALRLHDLLTKRFGPIL